MMAKTPQDLETQDPPAPAPAPQAASAAPEPRHPTDSPAKQIAGVQAFGKGALCVLLEDNSVWTTEDFSNWTEVLPAFAPGGAKKK